MSIGAQHSEGAKRLSIERETFFRTLYHDDRNSVYAVATCVDGVWSESMRRRSHLDFIGSPEYGSLYASVNGFAGAHRRSDALRQLNALFFDLDCHAATPETARSAIEEAFASIGEAIRAGRIPKPTLIVDSGRGLHLYYVLKRSIPYRCAANGQANDKAVNLFRYTQRQLAHALARLLSPISCIEVDEKVFDFTRVSRVPGSFNPAAGRFARLLASNSNYYDLAELKTSSPAPEARDHSSRPANSCIAKALRKGGDSPLLRSRLQNVVSLQALRGFCCEGSRELMCFVFYNTAVQLSGKAAAKHELVQFNARFSSPLPPSELEGVIRSVDRVVNVRGQRGFYVLSAQKITELLALTDGEKSRIRFHASTRSLMREKTKRETSSRRRARNERIVSLYGSGNLTQKEVSELVGCSLRTVAGVLGKATTQSSSTCTRRKKHKELSLVVQQETSRKAMLPWMYRERYGAHFISLKMDAGSKRVNPSATCTNLKKQAVSESKILSKSNNHHIERYNKLLEEHAIFCHTSLGVVPRSDSYALLCRWVV